MKTILIRGGTVVNADKTVRADVLVSDGIIQAVSKRLGNAQADEVIDAKGCYVFPGGIDAHTHMELPLKDISSSDTFESGTRAALAGGTTTIIDFANQEKGGTIGQALARWHAKAHGRSLCDYAFHVSVTDYDERAREEIRACVENHGVTSFKIFTAYKGALMIDDRQIFELMRQVGGLGGIVTAHAENGDLIDSLVARNRALGNLAPGYHEASHPALAEAEAVSRLIDLASFAGCPLYIVHLSTAEAYRRALEASTRVKLFLETCPQYLLLDRKLYWPKSGDDSFAGARFVMSPPLRGKADREALWRGVKSGAVQVVATDHCPFFLSQKDRGREDFTAIPNGAPGVEHRMELLFSEGVLKRRMSLNRFVDVTSAAPAKIFGLYPKKGRIAVGADADIVIMDPRDRHVISASSHHMNCDYSAYEGWRVHGKCWITMLRGNVASIDGKVNIPAEFGKFLPRKPLKY